jgi:hypothetical protein
MADSLMKPFVLLITFIGVTIVLLGTMANLQASNQLSSADNVSTGMEAIAGFNYTMYNPTSGFEITWADVETNIYAASDNGYPDPDENHSVFYPQGSSPTSRDSVWAYVIRNETWDNWFDIAEPKQIRDARGIQDMVVFAQKYAKHGWFDIKFGLGWRYFVIPYESIVDHADGNISTISFMMGNDNLTAFFITPDSGDFSRALFTNNTYTMGLGQIWGLENVGRASMWKLVGQLLTCSLPNTNYYANLIMTIAIWAVIAYVAIAMISRFIPTISGL